jgi:hypothetical protein
MPVCVLLQRRSSRLVSRSCREEEIRRQEQLEEEAAAAASIAEQAEAAALAAAARAMAVVPTTASGAPAAQLLDVLPEQRLALLIEQVGALVPSRLPAAQYIVQCGALALLLPVLHCSTRHPACQLLFYCCQLLVVHQAQSAGVVGLKKAA